MFSQYNILRLNNYIYTCINMYSDFINYEPVKVSLNCTYNVLQKKKNLKTISYYQ